MQHCALFVLDLIAAPLRAGANEFTPFNRREAATLDRGRNRHFDVFSPRLRATTTTGIHDSRPRQRVFTPTGRPSRRSCPLPGLDQIDVVEV